MEQAQQWHPLAFDSSLIMRSGPGCLKWISPWNSPGQNTGVGTLSLLQGIFLTQGSNPGLLHCGQILHHLSYRENLPGGGHGNCMENPMDSGAWRAIVHGVAKSRTWWATNTFTFFHFQYKVGNKGVVSTKNPSVTYIFWCINWTLINF